MTDMDNFAGLSRRIAYDPAWHLDEDTAVYLREDIDRALRDTRNAALEEAASLVNTNWEDFDDVFEMARAIRARKAATS